MSSACLVRVDLEELPDLFKESRRYKSGNFKQSTFALFSNGCHFDLTIHSYRELCWTLDTLQYWGFEKVPENVYRNVVGRETRIRQIFDDNCRDLFLKYPNFAPLLEIGILAFGKSLEEKVAMAQHHGLTNLLDFLQPLERHQQNV